MKKAIRLLSIFLFLLVGCKTYETCLIEGTSVTNPTLGFSGIHFQFPEDYHQTLTNTKEISSYGQLAWHKNLKIVQPMGHYTEEMITFEKDGVGISLKINKIAEIDNFSRVPEQIIKKVMIEITDSFKFETGDLLYRKTEKIQEHWTAKIAQAYANKESSYINVIYIIPGTLKEIYIFNGVAHPSMQKELEADLEATIQSFSFES